MSNYDLTLEKEVTREFAWEVMANILKIKRKTNEEILLNQLQKSFGDMLGKLPIMTMEEVLNFQIIIKFLNDMLNELVGEWFEKLYVWRIRNKI